MMMLAFLANCVSLSPAGEKVQYKTKEEPPANCKMLPKTFAENFGAVTQESLINSLRNDVGEAGGNLLIIDTMTGVARNNSVSYVGTGRGYICP